jgi:RNA-directed DNA polymerase
MKRYNNLFEQVVSFKNMLLASKKALKGKKTKTKVSLFHFNLENEIIGLQNELISQDYLPGPYRQFEIREPKARKICSSDFRDRVVHHAICNVIEPVITNKMIFDTYACIENKGTHAAVKKAALFAGKYKYFLKCDIRKYFESIDHDVLKQLLRRVIKDKKLLKLIDIIIDHKVPGYKDGKGLPIGNLTSQHFANFYLSQLDHFLKDRLRVKGYIRYMDDFIVFADEKDKLNDLLKVIGEFLRNKLDLELKEEVTRIAPATEGVPFLGFNIYSSLIRIQRKNLIRVRRKIKERKNQFIKGIISEESFISSMHSMISHLSYGNTVNLRRKEFI